MNYHEDPDDDGQAQRDERVERRLLAEAEADNRGKGDDESVAE